MLRQEKADLFEEIKHLVNGQIKDAINNAAGGSEDSETMGTADRVSRLESELDDIKSTLGRVDAALGGAPEPDMDKPEKKSREKAIKG